MTALGNSAEANFKRTKMERLSPEVVLAESDLVFCALWAPCTVICKQNRGPWAVILHGISRDAEQIVSVLEDHR